MQTSSEKQVGVQVFHIRRKVDGIPEMSGGYTVIVKERQDGRYNVTISQCHVRQRYDEKLGEKIALSRMKQGLYFATDWKGVEDTLNTLRSKVSEAAPLAEALLVA